MAHDPYVDPRTGVLRNRLGITDPDELRAVEADVSAAALYRLEVSLHLGEGHFDFAHLCGLHAQTFGDLYRWAGTPRTVNIDKGVPFCLAPNIESSAASIFDELAANNFLVGLDRPDLVVAVAALYADLNALHAFREGNGRTQRLFLTRLGVAGGWRIRWADLDADINTDASARSLLGDNAGLTDLFDELLEEAPRSTYRYVIVRRAVLACPQVAEIADVQVEDFRAGPYPDEFACAYCEAVEQSMADEPTVMLVQHIPSLETHRIGVAHARCGRSVIAPPMPARLARAWHAQQVAESDDAWGAAALIGSDRRPAFAWMPAKPVLVMSGSDPIDLWLNRMLVQGFEITATGEPPPDVTPGWSLHVSRSRREITITDPEGDEGYVGSVGSDEPPGWYDAIEAAGRCVLFVTSRADLTNEWLAAAAERGRLLVALAEATVED